MWKFSATVTLLSCLWATVQTEFTILPSNEVAAYYYPAPAKTQRLYAAPREPASQSYQNQYQSSYQTLQHAAYVTKQFSTPDVDNVGHNLALTNQGYVYGNQQPAFNAAFKAISRSSKPAFKTPSTSTSTSTSSSPSSATIGSLNVKLPLPAGISPINIAPLPLQAGAPYAASPRGVTSYGTIYPQRKRR